MRQLFLRSMLFVKAFNIVILHFIKEYGDVNDTRKVVNHVL